MTEYEGYCTIDQIKERVLIPVADVQYDTPLESAGAEASRLIDMYLTPYEDTLPLTTVPEIIADICADFASSIFRRRALGPEVKLRGQLSPEGQNIIEASGWWGIALKKLETYIYNVYQLGSNTPFEWTSCNDADLVLRALDRRMIGIAEARAILQAMTFDPTSKTEAEIDLIMAQIELIDAQIAKMAQDGLLVEAQTLKLATVDTDKVTAEIVMLTAEVAKLSGVDTDLITEQIARITAEVINLGKTGSQIDAQTALIGAQSTKLSGADTDLITEQIARITAEVTKLSGADTSKITQEIANLVAQVTLMGKQGLLVDAQELKTDAETAKIEEETEQMPKRGSTFKFCDEDEEEEE